MSDSDPSPIHRPITAAVDAAIAATKNESRTPSNTSSCVLFSIAWTTDQNGLTFNGLLLN